MLTVSQALPIALDHHRAGRLLEAEQIYRQILQADPNQAYATHLLGVLAQQAGRHEAAVESMERAITLKGDVFEFHNELAKTYHTLRRIPEAIARYRRALEINAQVAETHYNLGLAYKEQGNLGEAVDCLRRTLEINPALAEAHNNLGAACKELGRLEEAVACYRIAAELKPDFALAHSNLGVVFKDLGRLEDALRSCRRALELEPQNPQMHLRLAGALFLLGQYEEAWAHYEARLALPAPRAFSAARWNREPAEGETILLHCEQGFGDSICFLRYTELIRRRARAACVIVECQPALTRLLAESVDSETVIVPRGIGGPGSHGALPHYDWHLPLLSAPLALAIFEPWPMSRPYLRAEPELQALWRRRLTTDGGLRVGLVWKGSPTHDRDDSRSLRCEELASLRMMPGIHFYSLQVSASSNEVAALAASGITDLAPEIRDFADTAAIVAEMDLMISVDTAVAHLAGAMGRPVWILLAFLADWRWGLQGESTPWYPTMRLFRQPQRGDWDSVLQRTANELAILASTKAAERAK